MVIMECWSQINDRLEKQLGKHTCSSSINKLMRVLKAHWLLPELRAKNCCSTFSFSSTLDQRKPIRANCVCWAGSEAVMTCNVMFSGHFVQYFIFYMSRWSSCPSVAGCPNFLGLLHLLTRRRLWQWAGQSFNLCPTMLTIHDHRWPMITINDHHRSSLLMDIIF